MSDLSLRPKQRGWQRMADTLLRSLGGSEALLRVPVFATSAVCEQLGAPSAGFADVRLAPAAFRKVRVPMNDGSQARYELLLSATAVEEQVSQLGLTSAEVLFAIALGFTVAGEFFLIEGVSFTSAVGLASLYRVLLRSGENQSY